MTVNLRAVTVAGVVLLALITAGEVSAGEIKTLRGANGFEILTVSSDGKSAVALKDSKYCKVSFVPGGVVEDKVIEAGSAYAPRFQASGDLSTVITKIKSPMQYVIYNEQADSYQRELFTQALGYSVTRDARISSNGDALLSKVSSGYKLATRTSAGWSSIDLQSGACSSVKLWGLNGDGSVAYGYGYVSGVSRAIYYKQTSDGMNAPIYVDQHISSNPKYSNVSLTSAAVSNNAGNMLAGFATTGDKNALFLADIEADGSAESVEIIEKIYSWDKTAKKMGESIYIDSLLSAGTLDWVNISDAGNVAVGNFTGFDVTDNFAFVWFADREITLEDGTIETGFAMRLDEYATMQGLVLENGADLIISEIVGLSDNGHVFTCADKTGAAIVNYQLTLPEPASLAILIAGGAVLLKRRKKSA